MNKTWLVPLTATLLNTGCEPGDTTSAICNKLQQTCSGVGEPDPTTRTRDCQLYKQRCGGGADGGLAPGSDAIKPPPTRDGGPPAPRPDAAPPAAKPDAAPPKLDGPPGSGSKPPGPNTTTPYPIDMGDTSASTPGTYKNLWLRLTDNKAPTITAVSGKIGVVCVGMSNSNQECAHYISEIHKGSFSGAINSAVKVVNCAVGGHAIERWNDTKYDSTLWGACINSKLGQAGLTASQVRVIYHKAANQFTTASGGGALPLYPDANSDYRNFYDNLTTFSQRVKKKFPSVQAVYTTSRAYGGFVAKASRGEPLSYEEGHALNAWLEANASVDGVWYGWGPYIWAPDCATGVKNKSGVCYVKSDFVSDGVHPAAGAEAKITKMIHARFSREAWY